MKNKDDVKMAAVNAYMSVERSLLCDIENMKREHPELKRLHSDTIRELLWTAHAEAMDRTETDIPSFSRGDCAIGEEE